MLLFKKKVHWLIVITMMISTCSFSSETVHLMSMNIRPAPQLTQCVLYFTKKPSGKVTYQPITNRLILELSHTDKCCKTKSVTFQNANVTMMSMEITPHHHLRLIFVVKKKVKWTTRFIHKPHTKLIELQFDISSFHAALHESLALADSNQHSAKKPIPYIHGAKKWTIMVDAGHGGKDTGARGINGLEEKEVVLSIARKLVAELNRDARFHAVMTRQSDYFVPLRDRVKLAHKANADLFIAIHADAYFNAHATGISVYALSRHGATSEAARWLAQRNNYSEFDGNELGSLHDQSPIVRSILIDLVQTATIQNSIRFGNKVLDSLETISSLHYSHVEQAPFMVLKSPDIPSILVETGYISNPIEERLLADDAYRSRLAHALYLGILNYMK